MRLLNTTLLGCLFLGSLTWAQVPSQEETVDRIVENLMCTCGCPHLIGQCGDECGVAPQLILEISNLLSQGNTEEEVYAVFEAKYGLAVLAVPKAEGFNMLLWILPGFGIFAGAVIVFVVFNRLKPVNRDHEDQKKSAKIDKKYRELIDREVGH
ncbi:MAG: cytochrome c-type biogenesis protein CcmH [Acidobacteria bacterium]|nr:cytochrome c-type biogenesis protein CcmH [Acidobacteriota bacterium]